MAKWKGVQLDLLGHEVPDPTPLALPVGFKTPESLTEQIQRLVRGAISQEAAERGEETFEEADDFDVDDELDFRTPYEMDFDPVLGREVSPEMMQKHAERYQQEYLDKVYNHPATERKAQEAKKRNRWPFFRRGEAPEERGDGPKPPNSVGPAPRGGDDPSTQT